MFRNEEIYKIKVVSPGTDDRYDVSLSDLGISKEVATGCTAIVLCKNPGTGVGSSDDYEAVMDPANDRLTIKEGSDGFSDNDVFYVAIVMPIGPVTGTSRAS